MSQTYNYNPDLEDVLDKLEIFTAGHIDCDCHWCTTWTDIVRILNILAEGEAK